MRIDALTNNQTPVQINVSDLTNKLETGDVIKAKVLDVKSDEVLLRLSDGSMLKASAGEDLQVKAGQTLSLTVTSKSEGTVYLETSKDQAQLSPVKPDLMKNLLSSLDLKPDAKNLELAAEFIKAGIKPTAEQFESASFLKESAGFSAEKAVFIASKGIQADPSTLELLSKLLDGELKLGDQLKNLSAVLDNASKTTSNTATGNLTAKSSSDVSTNDLAAKTDLDAKATAILDKSASANKDTLIAKAVLLVKTANTELTGKTIVEPNRTAMQKTPVNSLKPSEEQSQTTNKAQTASDIKTLGIPPRNASAGRAGMTDNASARAVNGNNTGSREETASLNNSRTADSRNDGVQQDHQARATEGKTDLHSRQEQGITLNSSDETANKAVKQTRTASSDITNNVDKPDTSSSALFSKLKDAVRDVFIRLDSDKTAAELDLGKSQRELANKLELLRNTLQSTELAEHPSGGGITTATSLVENSAKLLNQLNSSNVMYYQLPVNLAGRDTTAELYLMKRQQGKKRIDPRNSVMFVSLDTQNLGRFESLIDVKGTNITLNIRTEKKEINEFIKENIKHLYTGLSESGYKLSDIRYALIGQATPPLKVEQILSQMTDASRTKVDLRI